MTVLKINDELRSKMNQQKDLIDQLTNENEVKINKFHGNSRNYILFKIFLLFLSCFKEWFNDNIILQLLEHQRNNLGKTLRDSFTSRRDSLVHQYKTCLADSSSVPDIGTVPIYTSPYNKNSPSNYHSPNGKLSSPKSPTFSSPISSSLMKNALLRRVLKNSTPNTHVSVLDFGFSTELRNYRVPSFTRFNSLKPARSLPSFFYTERSNVVQDQGSEDECDFKMQDASYKGFARDSLHAEISQVCVNTFLYVQEHVRW